MRTRTKVVLTSVAVTAVALVSTVHAVRREDAVDDRARRAALSAVDLALVGTEQVTNAVALPGATTRAYDVVLRNYDEAPVLVRHLSWYDGVGADVDALLATGETRFVRLPQPPCPTKRATRQPEDVTVTYEVAGVTRTRRLPLPDRQSPLDQLNSGCGLFRASESNTYGAHLVRSRPGQVTVDLSLAFFGSRDTVVQQVRAADGVDLQVVEELPLTLRPMPQTDVIDRIAHTFTVTLTLQDCEALVRAVDRDIDDYSNPVLPPLFSELQLTVQRPGDDPEKLNVAIGVRAQNALSLPCRPRIPPVSEEELEGVAG